MTNISPPSPPVIGGHPANHNGHGNKPIRRVVVHSAVMPCEPGRARQLGEWNRDGTVPGSWHYSVDPVSTYQCSYDSYVCWHAPPNDHSLGIEMADTPGRRPITRALRRLNPWRWRSENHRKMLDRTAYLVAKACLAYDLPTQFVNARGLRAGRKGWTTHAQVSRAWRQSTHWDPGWWPRRKFGRMVDSHAAKILAEAREEDR